ncbi:MAG: YgjV family protein [Treponema sp.]|nr:YgjV family protein [Treponema sp.]
MTIQTLIEMIGYFGSFLVIVSMLMTSVVKLRIINTVGSVIFCGYAICIHSYPTAAMQLCLIAINIINLYKLMNTKKEYTAVNVKAEDGFLNHFLDENFSDIAHFFPDCSKPSSDDEVILIMCGQNPAGVFVASKENDDSPGALFIKLDYTTPAYRDTSAAKFLFDFLKSQGVQKLSTKTIIPAHKRYLKKMGFEQNGEVYVRTL